MRQEYDPKRFTDVNTGIELLTYPHDFEGFRGIMVIPHVIAKAILDSMILPEGQHWFKFENFMNKQAICISNPDLWKEENPGDFRFDNCFTFDWRYDADMWKTKIYLYKHDFSWYLMCWKRP